MMAGLIKKLGAACALLTVLGLSPLAQAFDHNYGTWQALLGSHVRWIGGGNASQVDYAGIKNNHQRLNEVLQTFSAVPQTEYDRWNNDQQLAFLINAYNAFTIELILTGYPGLQSIKDLGSLLRSPWKKSFFVLLGKERHLDNVEHDLIRGRFREPRIHTAVVCASVGCPALRSEAFTAARLNAQLDDSMRRFLADRSRNRYNQVKDQLEVSSIFKWYGDDFTGNGGFQSVADLFARYADVLADEPEDVSRIKQQSATISFLDYDWSLNDIN